MFQMTLTLSDNTFSAAFKLFSAAPRYQKRIGLRQACSTLSSFFDKTEDAFKSLSIK